MIIFLTFDKEQLGINPACSLEEEIQIYEADFMDIYLLIGMKLGLYTLKILKRGLVL